MKPDERVPADDKAQELAREIAPLRHGIRLVRNGNDEQRWYVWINIGHVTFRSDLFQREEWAEETDGKIAALLRSRMGEDRWIPVEERLPKVDELPCLVWRGTTHRIEVGRPMPVIGKGTQDRWRPLPSPPAEEGKR